MKKAKPKRDSLRKEYDLKALRGGVRAKHLKAYRSGVNLAQLAPDVRAAFPNDAAVNKSLRALMRKRSA